VTSQLEDLPAAGILEKVMCRRRRSESSQIRLQVSALMGMEPSVARPADSVYLARLHSLDALDIAEGGLGRGHRLLPWEERPKC
jgi:hypothetical protein